MTDEEQRYPTALVRAACAEGDPAGIATLCTLIVSEIVARNGTIAAPVRVGGHIPDSLARNFAYRMVKACERERAVLPPELVELLQVVLRQDREPKGGYDLRYDDAEAILKEQPGLSTSALAKMVKLPRSSVIEWRRDKAKRKARVRFLSAKKR